MVKHCSQKKNYKSELIFSELAKIVKIDKFPEMETLTNIGIN